MNHWEMVRANAWNYLQTGKILFAFTEGRFYKVTKASRNKLSITAMHNRKQTTLKKASVEAASEKLRVAGSLPLLDFKKSPAKTTALLQFHPQIAWNAATGTVRWLPSEEETSLLQTQKFIDKASESDLEKVITSIIKRQQQTVYKTTVQNLYNNRCAISKADVPDALEPAYIDEKAGNNNGNVENAILLRKDLQQLFEKRLLLIHPERLTVHLHPALKESMYNQFEGVTLSPRIDSSRPDYDYLIRLWTSVDWTKDI